MKITIYELLGMIKDGKAPKLIKYDNIIWEYDGDYYSSKNNTILEEYCNLTISLNDEVEILEEEKKIPEKLEDRARFQYSQIPTWLEKKEIIKAINENFEKHQKAIYEIIDYLRSKGE